MFYKNLIKGKKGSQKSCEFDLFQNYVDANVADSKKDLSNVSNTYNFCLSNGELKTGYGFKKFQMPTDTTNLDDEKVVSLNGTEIYNLWSFHYYEINNNIYQYYLIYYNNLNNFGVANLFGSRTATNYVRSRFINPPKGLKARHNGVEALVFSDKSYFGIHLFSANTVNTYTSVPRMSALCAHYDKLYAVTQEGQPKLMYTDIQDITKWTIDNMKQIVLNDDLSAMNKLIAFNDYVYIFRDYGITKLSFYSTKGEFDISQVHQSESYIYPETIAQGGDKIYFLEDNGIYSFNGSQASKIDLDCDEVLIKAGKLNARAFCYNGKYYLACRYDFADGKKIGCENETGYVNNMLFVLDLGSHKVEILRGVDIKAIIALVNPYKSKVVACYNGQNKGLIGELTLDGEVFGEATEKNWTSVKSDLGFPDKTKRAKFLTIKTTGACEVCLRTENGSKLYKVLPSDNIQKIRVEGCGKEFVFSITTTEKQANISNVKLLFAVL